MSTDQLTPYDFGCPTCKSRKGSPCTYVRPAFARDFAKGWETWGQPTKSPHNARRQRLWDWRAKQRHLAWMEQHKDPVAAERRALADLAHQEHEQMRAWLALNKSLFLSM